MRSTSQVLAVIPAFNEASRIEPVIRGTSQYLSVLVVDDGSGDDTAGVAEKAGAIVLSLDPNQGKGAALRAGFRKALADGFEAVVTLDADGQHDSLYIGNLLDTVAGGAVDVAIGSRFGGVHLVGDRLQAVVLGVAQVAEVGENLAEGLAVDHFQPGRVGPGHGAVAEI